MTDNCVAQYNGRIVDRRITEYCKAGGQNIVQYIRLKEGRRILGRKWKHMGLNNAKMVSRRMTGYFTRIGELLIGRCQNIVQEDCRISCKMTNYWGKKSSIFGRRTTETTYFAT